MTDPPPNNRHKPTFSSQNRAKSVNAAGSAAATAAPPSQEREDQFIEELAELISTSISDMSTFSTKLDKGAILQEATSSSRVGPIHQQDSHEAVQQSQVSSSKPSQSILPEEILGPLLLEALEGFVFVVNSQGRVEFASDNITEYLSYTPDDLVGKSIYNVIHVGDHAEFSGSLLNLIQGQRSEGAANLKGRNYTVRMLINSTNGSSYDTKPTPQYENMLVSPFLQPQVSNVNPSTSTAESKSCLVYLARRLPSPQKTIMSMMESFVTKQHLNNGLIYDYDISGVVMGGHHPILQDHKLTDVCHANDTPLVLKHIKDVMTHGENTSQVYRIKLHDKRHVFVRTKSSLKRVPNRQNEVYIHSTHTVIRECENDTELKGSASTSLIKSVIGNMDKPTSDMLANTPLSMFSGMNTGLGLNSGINLGLKSGINSGLNSSINTYMNSVPNCTGSGGTVYSGSVGSGILGAGSGTIGTIGSGAIGSLTSMNMSSNVNKNNTHSNLIGYNVPSSGDVYNVPQRKVASRQNVSAQLGLRGNLPPGMRGGGGGDNLSNLGSGIGLVSQMSGSYGSQIGAQIGSQIGSQAFGYTDLSDMLNLLPSESPWLSTGDTVVGVTTVNYTTAGTSVTMTTATHNASAHTSWTPATTLKMSSGSNSSAIVANPFHQQKRRGPHAAKRPPPLNFNNRSFAFDSSQGSPVLLPAPPGQGHSGTQRNPGFALPSPRGMGGQRRGMSRNHSPLTSPQSVMSNLYNWGRISGGRSNPDISSMTPAPTPPLQALQSMESMSYGGSQPVPQSQMPSPHGFMERRLVDKKSKPGNKLTQLLIQDTSPKEGGLKILEDLAGKSSQSTPNLKSPASTQQSPQPGPGLSSPPEKPQSTTPSEDTKTPKDENIILKQLLSTEDDTDFVGLTNVLTSSVKERHDSGDTERNEAQPKRVTTNNNILLKKLLRENGTDQSHNPEISQLMQIDLDIKPSTTTTSQVESTSIDREAEVSKPTVTTYERKRNTSGQQLPSSTQTGLSTPQTPHTPTSTPSQPPTPRTPGDNDIFPTRLDTPTEALLRHLANNSEIDPTVVNRFNRRNLQTGMPDVSSVTQGYPGLEGFLVDIWEKENNITDRNSEVPHKKRRKASGEVDSTGDGLEHNIVIPSNVGGAVGVSPMMSSTVTTTTSPSELCQRNVLLHQLLSKSAKKEMVVNTSNVTVNPSGIPQSKLPNSSILKMRMIRVNDVAAGEMLQPPHDVMQLDPVSPYQTPPSSNASRLDAFNVAQMDAAANLLQTHVDSQSLQSTENSKYIFTEVKDSANDPLWEQVLQQVQELNNDFNVGNLSASLPQSIRSSGSTQLNDPHRQTPSQQSLPESTLTREITPEEMAAFAQFEKVLESDDSIINTVLGLTSNSNNSAVAGNQNVDYLSRNEQMEIDMIQKQLMDVDPQMFRSSHNMSAQSMMSSNPMMSSNAMMPMMKSQTLPQQTNFGRGQSSQMSTIDHLAYQINQQRVQQQQQQQQQQEQLHRQQLQQQLRQQQQQPIVNRLGPRLPHPQGSMGGIQQPPQPEPPPPSYFTSPGASPMSQQVRQSLIQQQKQKKLKEAEKHARMQQQQHLLAQRQQNSQFNNNNNTVVNQFNNNAAAVINQFNNTSVVMNQFNNIQPQTGQFNPQPDAVQFNPRFQGPPNIDTTTSMPTFPDNLAEMMKTEKAPNVTLRRNQAVPGPMSPTFKPLTTSPGKQMRGPSPQYQQQQQQQQWGNRMRGPSPDSRQQVRQRNLSGTPMATAGSKRYIYTDAPFNKQQLSPMYSQQTPQQNTQQLYASQTRVPRQVSLPGDMRAGQGRMLGIGSPESMLLSPQNISPTPTPLRPSPQMNPTAYSPVGNSMNPNLLQPSPNYAAQPMLSPQEVDFYSQQENKGLNPDMLASPPTSTTQFVKQELRNKCNERRSEKQQQQQIIQQITIQQVQHHQQQAQQQQQQQQHAQPQQQQQQVQQQQMSTANAMVRSQRLSVSATSLGSLDLDGEIPQDIFNTIEQMRAEQMTPTHDVAPTPDDPLVKVERQVKEEGHRRLEQFRQLDTPNVNVTLPQDNTLSRVFSNMITNRTGENVVQAAAKPPVTASLTPAESPVSVVQTDTRVPVDPPDPPDQKNSLLQQLLSE